MGSVLSSLFYALHLLVHLRVPGAVYFLYGVMTGSRAGAYPSEKFILGMLFNTTYFIINNFLQNLY